MNEKNCNNKQTSIFFSWGLQLNIFSICLQLSSLFRLPFARHLLIWLPPLSPSPRHLKTWLIDFNSKFNTLMNFKEISLGKSISFYARIVNSDSSDLDLKLCRNSRVKFKATTRWISSAASFFTSWSLAFFEILSLSAASKVFCSEDFSRFDKVAKSRRVGHSSGNFYLEDESNGR